MGNTLSSAFIPTPPPRDLFLNLPEELLLVIIHSLGDTNSQIYLSRVNKRFHRIVMPEVWKKTKHRRDSQRRGWLHRAAESGDLYMVRTLVNAGAKTNWNWSGFPIASPVYLAGKEGQPKVIELILSLQSDLIKFITSVDPSVLHACAYTGDLKLVMKILRAFKYPRRLCGHPSFRPRFYVPYEGVALIHAAAYGGNPCIIRQFAKRQVDLFALTRCRMTALHVAALKGHCHAIKLLVYYKVPIEAVDRLGRTAWSLAMGCGHFEAAQLLVKLGAKENVGYHNVSFSWDNLAGG